MVQAQGRADDPGADGDAGLIDRAYLPKLEWFASDDLIGLAPGEVRLVTMALRFTGVGEYKHQPALMFECIGTDVIA